MSNENNIDAPQSNENTRNFSTINGKIIEKTPAKHLLNLSNNDKEDNIEDNYIDYINQVPYKTLNVNNYDHDKVNDSEISIKNNVVDEVFSLQNSNKKEKNTYLNFKSPLNTTKASKEKLVKTKFPNSTKARTKRKKIDEKTVSDALSRAVKKSVPQQFLAYLNRMEEYKKNHRKLIEKLNSEQKEKEEKKYQKVPCISKASKKIVSRRYEISSNASIKSISQPQIPDRSTSNFTNTDTSSNAANLNSTFKSFLKPSSFLERLKDEEEKSKLKREILAAKIREEKAKKKAEVEKPFEPKYKNLKPDKKWEEKMRQMREQQRDKREKFEMYAKIMKEYEMKDCSFKPQINHHKKIYSDNDNITKKLKFTVSKRLYNNDIILRKEKQKALKDKYTPSFKPDLNKGLKKFITSYKIGGTFNNKKTTYKKKKIKSICLNSYPKDLLLKPGSKFISNSVRHNFTVNNSINYETIEEEGGENYRSLNETLVVESNISKNRTIYK